MRKHFIGSRASVYSQERVKRQKRLLNQSRVVTFYILNCLAVFNFFMARSLQGGLKHACTQNSKPLQEVFHF